MKSKESNGKQTDRQSLNLQTRFIVSAYGEDRRPSLMEMESAATTAHPLTTVANPFFLFFQLFERKKGSIAMLKSLWDSNAGHLDGKLAETERK